MIPPNRLFIFTVTTPQKNVGIHLLLVCYLRPTTALQVDEQGDTHDVLLKYP